MTLSEERMQILKMLEDGKITADDAAKLISAMEIGVKKESGDSTKKSAAKGKRRWLRVRVTDQVTGKQKVSVNLPMGLVDVGMKMGAKFAPEIDGLDLGELMSHLDASATGGGKIIDVTDDEDGERVEIFVE